MALCNLEEWLRRMGIQRQKCDVGQANAWRKVEGVMLDRKIKKTERESPENVCYTSMPVWSSGVDRTTTTEAASV